MFIATFLSRSIAVPHAGQIYTRSLKLSASGTLKDGIFTYETTFVGGVVVFGDELKEDPKDPDSVTPDLPTLKKPDTSVKGNYTGGMGGAGTGDSINLTNFILSFACAGILCILFCRKARQRRYYKH